MQCLKGTGEFNAGGGRGGEGRGGEGRGGGLPCDGLA